MGQDNLDSYPKIKQVFLLIGYDTDMVADEAAKEAFLEQCQNIIGADGVYADDLDKLEEWLATLTEEQLVTLANGEDEERFALEANAPNNPDGFPMTGIFDDLF